MVEKLVKHFLMHRNVFHAFYTIGKVDGISALQKGLVPGMTYQFIMNGLRLGECKMYHFSRVNLITSYSTLKMSWNKTKDKVNRNSLS